MDLICRIRNGQQITFDSAKTSHIEIEEIIKQDSKYGFMKNSGIITYAILNGDQELTEKEIEDSVFRAFYKWMVHVKIDFVRVQKDQNPDVTIQFNSESEDEILDSSTIAYMGYPIKGNKFYGVCVINKRYFYSMDGNPVSGHRMMSLGFPVQFPEGQYSTIDLDVVLYHEFGHGVFGLPHSQFSGNGMSYRYDLMSELPSNEDISRATAKAERRGWPEHVKKKILSWIGRWSDS